jgi:DNA mismatch repair protein MutS
LRDAAGNSRRAIAALEARYREDGHALAENPAQRRARLLHRSASRAMPDRLMQPDSGFTHRQTMAGAVRFNALALHEEASRIAEAGGHALAAEEAISRI